LRSYRAPREFLAIIRGWGGKGKERVGNREGRKRTEGKDVKGVGRNGKGMEGAQGRVEGGLDLDICPRAPSS